MSAAHTPGPWTACDPGDYSDYNSESIVILGDEKRIVVVQGSTHEAIANACLIAAAPKLLKALKQMIAWDDGERTAIDAMVNAREIVAEAMGEKA